MGRLTTPYRAGLLATIAGAVALLGLVAAHTSTRRESPAVQRVAINPARIVADGHDAASLDIESTTPSSVPPRIAIIENPHAARIEDVVRERGAWHAVVRAGIVPGRVVLRVEFPGGPPARVELLATPAGTDSFEDGTPDSLRLDDDRDRQAFRRWFTYLAEAQYFQALGAMPAEIEDCAALIRYAYREALKAHDRGWAADARLPLVPALESVVKYEYPYTPLGAALFRVQGGPFRPEDLQRGAFAQFADAKTIRSYNTFSIGRSLARALPGDLLFFRQSGAHETYHSMIYLGESQFQRGATRYVVYHTGPDGNAPGEIRRLTLEQLLRYPQPEWRPVPGNPAFLGVFRWNILRKESDAYDGRE